MKMFLRWLSPLVCLALSAVAAAPDVQTLTVDRAVSRVEIVVKATVDSFVGRLSDYDAQITVDPAANQVRAVAFAFAFANVKTGKDGRDKKMNEWQQTDQFPDGVFTLAQLTTDASGRQQAHGKLRFHGQEQEVSFPVSVTRDGPSWAFDGEATLDTRTFGLPVIRMIGFLKVDPLVVVRFHLQAHQLTKP